MKLINSNLDYITVLLIEIKTLKGTSCQFGIFSDDITENLDSYKREDFHKFLTACVDIFTKIFMQQQIIHINIENKLLKIQIS